MAYGFHQFSGPTEIGAYTKHNSKPYHPNGSYQRTNTVVGCKLKLFKQK